ncbi:fms-related tyrosine kinase 3 ligand [Pogona vitticeps]
MSWHYGIPNLSVVFLLLVSFSTPSESSQVCSFEHNPLHSGNFSREVGNLKQYLLFDYPVSVPSNLKLDAFCLELWEVHFINKNFNNMLSVSGNELKKLIQNVTRHTNFAKECNFTDSCVTFEKTNISHFLEPIPSLLATLRDKMNEQIDEEPVDFHNCTIIQCQPDLFTTPAGEKQRRTQPSEQNFLGRSYWGLLVIPVFPFLIILSLLCRKRSQRLPRFEEPNF